MASVSLRFDSWVGTPSYADAVSFTVSKPSLGVGIVDRCAINVSLSGRGPIDPPRDRPPDGTVADVLKVAIIVLVILVLLLGLPLGMPMSGTSMCPSCGDLGTWSLMCIALLGSIVLLVRRRVTGILGDRALGPLLVTADPLERPPRSS